jgi:hypothetical protein
MTDCDWERRRSTVTAEARCDGVLVAEATASFALLPPSRFGL